MIYHCTNICGCKGCISFRTLFSLLLCPPLFLFFSKPNPHFEKAINLRKAAILTIGFYEVPIKNERALCMSVYSWYTTQKYKSIKIRTQCDSIKDVVQSENCKNQNVLTSLSCSLKEPNMNHVEQVY